MFATDWIAYHADRTPDKVALIDQFTQREFTYDDLNHRVGMLAGYLQDEWNIQEGDRVAVLGKSSTYHFEIQFACYRLGAIFLPLNWRLAPPELLTILNDSQPIGLIYDNEFAGHVDGLLNEYGIENLLRLDVVADITDDAVSYEDAISSSETYVEMPIDLPQDTPGTLMYTTPTSGVIITQGMTLWNAINVSLDGRLNANSVYYGVLPTFHTAGLNLYVNPLIYVGGTSIVARDFVPDMALSALTDPAFGVTHVFGVPAIYLFLTKAEGFATADLSHVQQWIAGGAPMPVELLELYAQKALLFNQVMA